MRQLVDSLDTTSWIAEQDGCMVGFAIVQHSIEDQDRFAYIQTIEVSPSARRQGVARELLLRMEESARKAGALEIGLHVDETNAAAIALYCAYGYEKQGRQPHYYARNRSAEIYRKLLNTQSP
jgi:ribosomal-protein-alanine N-acetyltransferase